MALALMVFQSQAAQAIGDPKRGADAFSETCAVCHSATKGKNKYGPSLFGLIGRRAGSVPDYAYSESMKQSGFLWTPNKLDAYIDHPKQVVPGNKMPFNGLADDKDRADIIAYLSTLH
jgi:cytochrome c